MRGGGKKTATSEHAVIDIPPSELVVNSVVEHETGLADPPLQYTALISTPPD
jgi:hypothetical protein